MFQAKNMLFFLVAALCVSAMLNADETKPQPVTPEAQSKAEKAIQLCEEKFQAAKDMRAEFDRVKKPGLLDSLKAKNRYRNLELNRKVFDLRLEQFMSFTNEKVKIRTAKTIAQLQDQLVAYSSNCTRFSDGLKAFVSWATTDKPEPGFEKIFKSWQDEARSSSKKK